MGTRVGITYGNVEKLFPYEEALRSVGLEPRPISPQDPAVLDGLDGLLVSGGEDLDPAMYGQPRHPLTQDPNSARDAMEKRLLEEALQRDLPVLCICRGCQLFNVIHGGTLVQHLERNDVHQVRPLTEAERALPVHPVRVDPGTKLAAILGDLEHGVNSRHHQGVDALGAGLVVSARAPDGTVEGLERPDRRFAVAVQWHPENSAGVNEKDRRLFEAFAAAVIQS